MSIEVLLEALAASNSELRKCIPSPFPEALARFELSATGMHPKVFPEALPASNYSVAGSALPDCRIVLSAGRDKFCRGGEKDSTDVNEKSSCS